MLRKVLILLLLLTGLTQRAFSQSIEFGATDRLQKFVVSRLSLSDTTIALPHQFLAQGSQRVVVDSLNKLIEGRDYDLQYTQGILRIQREFLLSTLADSARHSLFVEYERLPFSLKREYSLHIISPLVDSTLKGRAVDASPAKSFRAEDVFGPGLERSGSIVRGLTIGSNRDLTLNSGFRLQMTGRIAAGLDLAAALTDENVPIQPEGTTQTLRELDKVFVQLRNPSFTATLGDFVHEISAREGGEFGRFTRKLQGATGSAIITNPLGAGSALEMGLTGATSRGKYTTNQFQGIEGNQGPYRLTGEESSRRPIIVAGTERVYVNGQRMMRGETNDYTIDYSTAEITFSPRRLVTNATRITVDFQYTDREFVRNLVGAADRFGALGEKLIVSTVLTQEADDDQSPIETELTDSLRSIIASSGRDRFRASVSGVRYVGRDSVTQAPLGHYTLKDTAIGGNHRPLLVYAPGDPDALYSCTFSFVDRMPVDSLGYRRNATGGFVVAGLGQGDYLPTQFLPVPELHRTVNGRVAYRPLDDLTIAAEYAASERNLNRLAQEGSTTSSGGAYKFQLSYHPRNLSVGGLDLGETELNITDRFVDRRFSPIDRYDEVEFSRRWNIESAGSGDEVLQEVTLSLRPHRHVKIGAGYGLLELKGSASSKKFTVDGSFADSTRARANFAADVVTTEDLIQSGTTKWIRQRGEASYQLWYLQPSVRYEAEDRQERSISSDTLRNGTFRYLEVAPGLALVKTQPLLISAELQFRTEDSVGRGSLRRAFNAITQLYELRLQDWQSLTSTISVSTRKTELTEDFAGNGNSNTNTILVRSQNRYAPWRRAVDLDLFYEYARERSAPMKLVFIRVPKGTGNYLYKGDLNKNGLPDESEFEQTRFEGDFIAVFIADDRLVPVSDVKSGMRLRMAPSRWFTNPVTTVEKLLGALSSETVARIEERGTDPDPANLYLLRVSRLLNDSTTISGTRLFMQDLYLYESDPAFSLRFRYSEKRSLLRLVDNSEHVYTRERSVRIRAQVLREIGNQTDLVNKIDRLSAAMLSPRVRDIFSNELRTEFSYRPLPEWEIAFGIALSQAVNHRGAEEPEADLNDQFIRLTYSLGGGGQLRTEVQREEAQLVSVSGSSSNDLPFEFTNGRVVGKTYQWRLAFDYRISQYIQISVGYDGRSEGARSAVHTGRAEAKAFF